VDLEIALVEAFKAVDAGELDRELRRGIRPGADQGLFAEDALRGQHVDEEGLPVQPIQVTAERQRQGDAGGRVAGVVPDGERGRRHAHQRRGDLVASPAAATAAARDRRDHQRASDRARTCRTERVHGLSELRGAGRARA